VVRSRTVPWSHGRGPTSFGFWRRPCYNPGMTVRWGIAGPGGIAERFADGMELVADGEIVAVASRSRDRADAFADRHDIPKRYGAYDDLAADPDVDVVYVATPHSRHEQDTLTYLAAAKHVLCEKPFALNAAQARRMAEAARAGSLFLMEAMWSRFLPAYRRLRELLDDGRIGEPLVVEADFGFRVPVNPEHRLFDLALGGGALLDLGIYPVQLCAFVLGPPERVLADGVIGETGADEVVTGLLHSGGRLGVVKAATRVALSCTARISGSDGWIGLPAPMHNPTALTIGGPGGPGGPGATGGTERVDAERVDTAFEGVGLRFQVEEVHRCLAAGQTESPVIPLDESIALLRVLDDMRAQLGVVYPGE
jgi:predicted dehydrogenase